MADIVDLGFLFAPRWRIIPRNRYIPDYFFLVKRLTIYIVQRWIVSVGEQINRYKTFTYWIYVLHLHRVLSVCTYMSLSIKYNSRSESKNWSSCLIKFSFSVHDSKHKFVIWYRNLVDLLHLSFGCNLFWYLGITFQSFTLLCLAKNHCCGFNSRNVHMVHIAISLHFEMVYPSNFISLIFVSLKSSIEDLKVLRELTF